jgi:hypothetical protein
MEASFSRQTVSKIMSDVCLSIWGQTSFSRLLITLRRCQCDWCQCAIERYSCKNVHVCHPHTQCGLTFVAFNLLLRIVLRFSDHFFTISMFYIVHVVVLLYYLSAMMCGSLFLYFNGFWKHVAFFPIYRH